MHIVTGFAAAKSMTHTVVLAVKMKLFQAFATVMASDANGMFGEAKGTMVTWVTLGGGLWLVWGVVTFAVALDDQNGGDMKRAMWKIIGGGMVIAAAQIFNHVS